MQLAFDGPWLTWPCAAVRRRYCFFVPGVAQKWRWGFYSCNGFDNPKFEPQMGGIQPLWRVRWSSS